MLDRRKITINFLHYVKGLDVKDAGKLYEENISHIDKVFDMFGDNVMIDVLRFIKNEQEEEKKDG